MFTKPTIEYSGHELKASLRAFISGALVCSQALAELAKKIEFYGVEVRFSGGVLVIDAALKEWAKRLEGVATIENQAETQAVISLRNDHLRYPYSVPCDRDREFSGTARRSFRDDLNRCSDTDNLSQMVIVDELLTMVDFDAMARLIQSQAASLVKAGYEQAANEIAELLGFKGYTPKTTKLTPRGLVFTSMYGGVNNGMDRFYFQQDLAKAVDALRIAEADLGISGTSRAISNVCQALSNYPGFETIPSRTVLGISGVLSAVVFKGKTEFTVEASRADALLSFIAQYSSIDLPALTADA
jgi:hypothetical protein